MNSSLVDQNASSSSAIAATSSIASVLAWAGSIMAVCGSLILALNFDISSWGWVLFTLSSLALLTWSTIERHYHQSMMQGIFLCTNLIGVYRWLLAA